MVMTDGGKGGFGDFGTVLAAEFAPVAEEGGSNGVGRLAEGEEFGQKVGGVGKLGWCHVWWYRRRIKRRL